MFYFFGQVSGSTATLVVICGWEAVIANVGDSCAYIDTGGEVVLVRPSLSLLCILIQGLRLLRAMPH